MSDYVKIKRVENTDNVATIVITIDDNGHSTFKTEACDYAKNIVAVAAATQAAYVMGKHIGLDDKKVLKDVFDAFMSGLEAGAIEVE